MEGNKEIEFSDILLKMRSRSQVIEFLNFSGKKLIILLGFYFPDSKGFNSEFFTASAKGKKKVKLKINLFKQLLLLSEVGAPKLPEYNLTDITTKTSLLSHIKSDEELQH